MKRILSAIPLVLALTTQAAEAPAGSAGAQQAAAGLTHAGLVAGTVGPRATAAAGPSLAAQHDSRLAAADQPGDSQPGPTIGMLLATIALMLGIVLRRWGASQQ